MPAEKPLLVMSKWVAKLNQIAIKKSLAPNFSKNLRFQQKKRRKLQTWAQKINWWLLIIWSDSIIIYLRYFPLIILCLTLFIRKENEDKAIILVAVVVVVVT